MRTYARIQDGVVAELLETDSDVAKLFPAELVWVEVSTEPNIRDGWRYDGSSFAPPGDVQGTVSLPTISELQAELAQLSAKLTALASQK